MIRKILTKIRNALSFGKSVGAFLLIVAAIAGWWGIIIPTWCTGATIKFLFRTAFTKITDSDALLP